MALTKMMLFMCLICSIILATNAYIADEKERGEIVCDNEVLKTEYKDYFTNAKKPYGLKPIPYCLRKQEKCGWTATQYRKSKLPIYVIAIGIEGSGHHLFAELLNKPIFEGSIQNAPHYVTGKAVSMMEPEELKKSLTKVIANKKSMYDSMDSFPCAAARVPARVFSHPDLTLLNKLDGEVFNVKYIVLTRNVTDAALSSLRRNYFDNSEHAIHTIEHSLIYLESVLATIDCSKMFVANYKHIMETPGDFIAPLMDFLEVESDDQVKALTSRLHPTSAALHHTMTKPKIDYSQFKYLTNFNPCASGRIKDPEKCYSKMQQGLVRFFHMREYLWPLFAM